MEEKPSWWEQIKKRLVAIVIVAIILVVATALIIVEVRLYGTGFAGKTLFDWLNLIGVLAVPVVVGFGAVWFTTQQGKVADAENTDNQRETALQNYIDKMSELLLHEKLRESQLEDEVRTIARVRTLTVLRGLDAFRKASVIQFLYETGLIHSQYVIVRLDGADLKGASLHFADLREANLRGADLRGADLRGAELGGVVNEAMGGAYLDGAILDGANLKDAKNITTEQLDSAKSLKGATMPDGSIHP